jgi:hypothetical protein
MEDAEPDDPMVLMARVKQSAGVAMAAAALAPVPDVTIFGFLPPPTPNSEAPDAPRNLRGYAVALLENK